MRSIVIAIFLLINSCSSFNIPKFLAIGTSAAVLSLSSTSPPDKLINANPNTLSQIVSDDITLRQALITADFTREIYSESATFKDEIDIYPIDKYIKGTKALFVPNKSHVDLTSPVTVTDDKIEFKFEEYLTFNIPILYPKVSLSGYVELFRDSISSSSSGSGGTRLVVRSVEHWDQPVNDVLKTATFFN